MGLTKATLHVQYLWAGRTAVAGFTRDVRDTSVQRNAPSASGTTHAMVPQTVVGVQVRPEHGDASCGGSLEEDGCLLRLAVKSVWSTPGRVMTCHPWQAVQYQYPRRSVVQRNLNQKNGNHKPQYISARLRKWAHL